MADADEWPKHMKKLVDGQIETVYAHTKKEKAAYEELGYVDNINMLEAAHYPRMVYNPKGETAIAENEGHEKALKKDGYGRTPVVAQGSKGSKAPTADPETATRMDALEEQVHGMQDSLNAILDALGSKAKQTA